MVLHLEEYKKEYPTYAHTINYYDKLPKMLHEMSADEILKEMNRNGSKAFYIQKAVIASYLLWLSKTYGVDVNDLYFTLYQNDNRKTFTFVGFFDFQDLQDSIIEAETIIEANSNVNRDYDGLYCMFYLEWLGVSLESFLTIRLEDVIELGRKIYIPAEKRSIVIDNETISDYIWEYKNATGRSRNENHKITEYKQNTLYRTTKGDEINKKTLYNARNHFVSECGDKRFSKNRIYDSGRFYEMYQEELKYGQEFKLNNNYSESNDEIRQIIRKIFNRPDMSNELVATYLRYYNVYKREYLKRL